MERALQLARSKDAKSIRLIQDAFNTTSLSLYTVLGFALREHVVVLHGRFRPESDDEKKEFEGISVRLFQKEDIDQMCELCVRIHGHSRRSQLEAMVYPPYHNPFVAIENGEIVAYLTTPSVNCHAVAVSNKHLKALLIRSAAQVPEAAEFQLPARNHEVFQWCLSKGLRTKSTRNLMSLGFYQEPKGAWIPDLGTEQCFFERKLPERDQNRV